MIRFERTLRFYGRPKREESRLIICAECRGTPRFYWGDSCAYGRISSGQIKEADLRRAERQAGSLLEWSVYPEVACRNDDFVEPNLKCEPHRGSIQGAREGFSKA